MSFQRFPGGGGANGWIGIKTVLEKCLFYFFNGDECSGNFKRLHGEKY